METKKEVILKGQHQFKDYIYWTASASVPLLIAVNAIAAVSWGWLILYILIFLGLLACIYRFFCTHCPHYKRESNRLKCMFFWGMPKIFDPRSNPLSFMDKLITFVAAAIIVLLPIYWLSFKPFMLIIYLLSLAVSSATIRRYECDRCVYKDCPSNCVDSALQ
jgi:hypothetical protein